MYYFSEKNVEHLFGCLYSNDIKAHAYKTACKTTEQS